MSKICGVTAGGSNCSNIHTATARRRASLQPKACTNICLHQAAAHRAHARANTSQDFIAAQRKWHSAMNNVSTPASQHCCWDATHERCTQPLEPGSIYAMFEVKHQLLCQQHASGGQCSPTRPSHSRLCLGPYHNNACLMPSMPYLQVVSWKTPYNGVSKMLSYGNNHTCQSQASRHSVSPTCLYHSIALPVFLTNAQQPKSAAGGPWICSASSCCDSKMHALYVPLLPAVTPLAVTQTLRLSHRHTVWHSRVQWAAAGCPDW